jgi:hypothetical protein
MNYTWVIGVFTGDRAKSVKAHADTGIGYFVQGEGGRGTNYEVHAAFRRPNDSPIPPELTVCNATQIKILEKKFAARDGNSRQTRESTADINTIFPSTTIA